MASNARKLPRRNHAGGKTKYFMRSHSLSSKRITSKCYHEMPFPSIFLFLGLDVTMPTASAPPCPLLRETYRCRFSCPPLPRTVLAKLTRRSAPRQVVSGMMSRVLALTPLRLKLCSQAVPLMKPRHWINPIPGSSPPPPPAAS